MASPEIFTIAQVPLTAHAFNADRTKVVTCLNTNEAQIYARAGNEWKQEVSLSEHDKLITSIDWAPNSNRIVTASQDRNAYVWTQAPDPITGKTIWKPTLVLLRINRAATYVRWSPNEDKFAVASGARAIAICSFDADNDWWVSRLLKKPIRSTVLSVDWHPNNVLLAAGTADMKARVFSAYIKDVDKKPAASVWGEKLPFNTICGEYGSPTGGWVHSVAFSPTGDVLAFASHDSTITIVYPAGPAVVTIRSTTLPYVTLTWTGEDALVAAGHDCQPVLFSGSTDGWKAVGSLDDAKSGAALTPMSTGSPAGTTRFGGGVGRLGGNEAFNRFRNADTRGSVGPSPGSPVGGPDTSGDTELTTIHQNTITSVRAYEYSGAGVVNKVSTTGVDGKLVIWNVVPAGPANLSSRLGGMQLR
ncbi:actin-related protein ARPC3 [Auriculariales sp. MPI-PUGE-AT-0066]|nr:actin-related protein ARPC3 [Auriculariales sp. MPI-PUGE-AT-0066]